MISFEFAWKRERTKANEALQASQKKVGVQGGLLVSHLRRPAQNLPSHSPTPWHQTSNRSRSNLSRDDPGATGGDGLQEPEPGRPPRAAAAGGRLPTVLLPVGAVAAAVAAEEEVPVFVGGLRGGGGGGAPRAPVDLRGKRGGVEGGREGEGEVGGVPARSV